MTELSPVVTLCPIAVDEWLPGSVGALIPGTSGRVWVFIELVV